MLFPGFFFFSEVLYEEKEVHVMKGQRNLTKPVALNIARAIGLDAARTEYFEDLVSFGQAKTQSDREYYFDGIAGKLLWLAFLCSAAFGATTLTGTVTDTGSNALSGVSIILTGLSNPSFAESTITNVTGSYQFDIEPLATYGFSARLAGYENKDGSFVVGSDNKVYDIKLIHIFDPTGTLHSGEVSGTWLPSGNPHRIVDNAIVKDSLYVAPGCSVVFEQPALLTLEGKVVFGLKGEKRSYIIGDTAKSVYLSNCKDTIKCDDTSSSLRIANTELCFVALLLIGIAGIIFESRHAHPEKSPFAAVRWQESQPEVRVGDEWFKLVSLDDLPAAEIVAFSQRTYGNKWQKRFEEDLVELLTRMGHPPQDTVTLVVQSLTSSETRTLEDVPMTRANRRAIRDAAQARERSERTAGRRGRSVPIDDAEAPLTNLIPGLRKEKKLVGLAAMVMVDGQVVASAADGERKKGSGVPIELGDRWHLGSVTKSITATMIARLVESGQMQWSDTIGERFPDASIHEDWKPVTLKQLLTHTAGAPANFSFQVMLKQPALGAECTQERRKAVMDVIAEKPAHPPGKKYAYSNVGYTIAAAMAEKVTGATWEDLVKREVFEPLELTGAGFGPPKSPSETLDQPRGHRVVLGWKVSRERRGRQHPNHRPRRLGSHDA